MVFRLFMSALWAALSLFAGWLALWLLAALELPALLQRHHPMTGAASSQFEQTRFMFLAALAISGAAWGALLPARTRYSERKLRELEATAWTMACLWGLVAAMVVTITFTDDRSIWLFAVLSALAAGGWVGAAGLMRVFAVLLVRHRRGQEAAAAGAAAESESPRLPLGHQPATRHGDLG